MADATTITRDPVAHLHKSLLVSGIAGLRALHALLDDITVLDSAVAAVDSDLDNLDRLTNRPRRFVSVVLVGLGVGAMIVSQMCALAFTLGEFAALRNVLARVLLYEAPPIVLPAIGADDGDLRARLLRDSPELRDWFGCVGEFSRSLCAAATLLHETLLKNCALLLSGDVVRDLSRKVAPLLTDGKSGDANELYAQQELRALRAVGMCVASLRPVVTAETLKTDSRPGARGHDDVGFAAALVRTMTTSTYACGAVNTSVADVLQRSFEASMGAHNVGANRASWRSAWLEFCRVGPARLVRLLQVVDMPEMPDQPADRLDLLVPWMLYDNVLAAVDRAALLLGVLAPAIAANGARRRSLFLAHDDDSVNDAKVACLAFERLLLSPERGVVLAVVPGSHATTCLDRVVPDVAMSLTRGLFVESSGEALCDELPRLMPMALAGVREALKHLPLAELQSLLPGSSETVQAIAQAANVPANWRPALPIVAVIAPPNAGKTTLVDSTCGLQGLLAISHVRTTAHLTTIEYCEAGDQRTVVHFVEEAQFEALKAKACKLVADKSDEHEALRTRGDKLRQLVFADNDVSVLLGDKRQRQERLNEAAAEVERAKEAHDELINAWFELRDTLADQRRPPFTKTLRGNDEFGEALDPYVAQNVPSRMVKLVTHVCVYRNLPLLRYVSLADTPGVTNDDEHKYTAAHVLQHSDAFMLLYPSKLEGNGIMPIVLETLQNGGAIDKPGGVVVTRLDEIPDSDQQLQWSLTHVDGDAREQRLALVGLTAAGLARDVSHACADDRWTDATGLRLDQLTGLRMERSRNAMRGALMSRRSAATRVLDGVVAVPAMLARRFFAPSEAALVRVSGARNVAGGSVAAALQWYASRSKHDIQLLANEASGTTSIADRFLALALAVHAKHALQQANSMSRLQATLLQLASHELEQCKRREAAAVEHDASLRDALRAQSVAQAECKFAHDLLTAARTPRAEPYVLFDERDDVIDLIERQIELVRTEKTAAFDTTPSFVSVFTTPLNALVAKAVAEAVHATTVLAAAKYAEALVRLQTIVAAANGELVVPFRMQDLSDAMRTGVAAGRLQFDNEGDLTAKMAARDAPPSLAMVGGVFRYLFWKREQRVADWIENVVEPGVEEFLAAVADTVDTWAEIARQRADKFLHGEYERLLGAFHAACSRTQAVQGGEPSTAKGDRERMAALHANIVNFVALSEQHLSTVRLRATLLPLIATTTDGKVARPEPTAALVPKVEAPHQGRFRHGQLD